jgi:hypothetical protein
MKFIFAKYHRGEGAAPTGILWEARLGPIAP